MNKIDKPPSPLHLEFGSPTPRHNVFVLELLGMKVFVHKAQLRYTLPEFLLPEPYCVPWPKGFKAETDEWAKEVCGVQKPLLKDGEILHTPTLNAFHCNEVTWEWMKKAAPSLSFVQSKGSWM